MYKKTVEIIILILIVVIVISLWYFHFFYGKQIKEIKNPPAASIISKNPTPTQILRHIYPLPTGTQAYIFSNARGTIGPKIQRATVTPLDATPNKQQTVDIIVYNDSPVAKVVANVYTDHGKKSYPMKLKSGTATSGTWTGTWNISDSFLYTYKIYFDLFSPTGNWSGGLTFRM